MEGPLSKWTNVMQGWQYRYFVLDVRAGILTYYTSKEKMIRGQRRGCVRLKGAIIGIDDEEDESTFTITVDQKMFHFQARDGEERERWIRALEAVIQQHTGYYRTKGKAFFPAVASNVKDFERKIQESDAYLQIMIEQIKAAESKLDSCTSPSQKEILQRIVVSANAMLESVKHTIVLLQICKNQVWPTNGVLSALSPPATLGNTDASIVVESALSSSSPSNILAQSSSHELVKASAEDLVERSVVSASAFHGGVAQRLSIPARSYSTSEDEDEIFFDTVEGKGDQSEAYEEDESDREDESKQAVFASTTEANVALSFTTNNAHNPNNPHPAKLQHNQSVPAEPCDDDTYDYDALYEDTDEDDLENIQEHGSVIRHLLSQVSIGMDLTKIVLPTFILERRSLLEMYADFFAHPDLFVRIVDLKTAEERMVQVVKWYLSAFHAGRKSSVAKKPYNPIIGETFQCYWPVPGLPDVPEKVEDGPCPSSSPNHLTYIAEQVSHHPPVSAFYAEHVSKRLQLNGFIWTKSKFLGLSIGVNMVGHGCVSVLDYDEEYIITFPSGYGRNILMTPWVELGGKCTISCAKTGYNATVDFLTKPFYGGKAHCIQAEAYRPGSKTSFLSVKGLWNGVMTRKTPAGEEVFLDVSKIPIIKKKVTPIAQQRAMESRKLWKHVTRALKTKDVHRATRAKHALEQRQRNEAKERAEKGTKWKTEHFSESGENWVYKWPLQCQNRKQHT